MKGIIKKLILTTWGLTLFIFALSSQAQIVEFKPIRVPQVDLEKLKAIEPCSLPLVKLQHSILFRIFF